MLKWIKRLEKLSYTPKEKWPSDINKRIYINSQMGLLIPRMGRLGHPYIAEQFGKFTDAVNI